MPVIAPFAAKKYGLQLECILHLGTQDGNGPADNHFPTATRCVDRYVESQALDVLTPADLGCALNYCDGMMCPGAELFEVDRDCESTRRGAWRCLKDSWPTWEDALKLGTWHMTQFGGCQASKPMHTSVVQHARGHSECTDRSV